MHKQHAADEVRPAVVPDDAPAASPDPLAHHLYEMYDRDGEPVDKADNPELWAGFVSRLASLLLVAPSLLFIAAAVFAPDLIAQFIAGALALLTGYAALKFRAKARLEVEQAGRETADGIE